jgi:hypothetical protein
MNETINIYYENIQNDYMKGLIIWSSLIDFITVPPKYTIPVKQSDLALDLIQLRLGGYKSSRGLVLNFRARKRPEIKISPQELSDVLGIMRIDLPKQSPTQFSPEEILEFNTQFPYLKRLFSWKGIWGKKSEMVKKRKSFDLFGCSFKDCTLVANLGPYRVGDQLDFIDVDFVHGIFILYKYPNVHHIKFTIR